MHLLTHETKVEELYLDKAAILRAKKSTLNGGRRMLCKLTLLMAGDPDIQIIISVINL